MDNMELMGELEHSTPSPSVDGQKGHSETGTGTDDDGSEATNEREAGEHAAPSGRRPYEDELRLGDCDGYGKEQRGFPSHMSSGIGGGFEGHQTKTDRHGHAGASMQARTSEGAGIPFEYQAMDDGCSPFGFLDDGGAQHKRKLSDVHDGHPEGSYHPSAHHPGTPGANYPSQNMGQDDAYRSYTKTIMGMSRENFFLKQQFGIANNQTIQLSQELSILQQQLHRLRLLVAKMHQGGQALTPHDEQLIPHCLRYAMDFDALGARAGGGVAMGGAAMHSMDARGGGAMHAMDAHMGDRMGDPAAIEMEAAGLMPRMKAAHHPAQQLAAAQHMRHMEHLPQHHQVSDDSALRRRKSQKQAAAGDAAHAHESLQQQQGLGEGSSSEAAASTGEDYRADAPHAAAGRDAQGEQTSERSTERMQQEAHRRAAGAPSGGASGTAAAGEARSAHRQGESALEEEQAAASRNADEAAAAMADESGADAGADGASCAEGKASSKEAAGEHSGADAAGSDAKAEKSEAGGGGSGATASGGKAEAGAGGGGGGQPRFWTVEEHKRFLEAVRLYGYGNARQIAAYVKTRSITQVRTHAQKYILKLSRMGSATNKEEEDQSLSFLGERMESMRPDGAFRVGLPGGGIPHDGVRRMYDVGYGGGGQLLPSAYMGGAVQVMGDMQSDVGEMGGMRFMPPSIGHGPDGGVGVAPNFMMCERMHNMELNRMGL